MLFQSGILPPNSGEDRKKKVFILFCSISIWIFGFLVTKWGLLAKKSRGPDIFCPLQGQTLGSTAPPKSMPMGTDVYGQDDSALGLLGARTFFKFFFQIKVLKKVLFQIIFN